MGGNVTAAHLNHQTMEEYIHYTSIAAEIAKLYVRNEEGAYCGDEHCCGVQLACDRLIDEFAAYNPKIKELYDELKNEYVNRLEREG